MSEADYRRIVRFMERIEPEPGVPDPRAVLRDSGLLSMILRGVRACPPENVEAALASGLLALAACVELGTRVAIQLKAKECPCPDDHERSR